jgi:hypothetical protein
MEGYQYHIFSPYRVCPIGAHVDHQHGLLFLERFPEYETTFKVYWVKPDDGARFV